MARHVMTSLEQAGGLWEWTCYCGDESTGHEDRDAAESAYEEHENDAAADAIVDDVLRKANDEAGR